MAKVVLNNLQKNFGDVTAVKDVNLEINDGEFFSIIGPSGCGKTTTLRLIAGLEQPTSGEVLIGDTKFNGIPAQKRNITLVFQDLALFPHMTAEENIGFGLRIQNMPKEEVKSKVEEAAAMLQIDELLDRSISDLSGGQQQRVALARSTVRDPDVFLLDEPLSDLDAKLKIDIRGELQEIHAKLGHTMVYVTHDQEEALTMSDRIAVMNDGELQQVGSPKELYHEPTNLFVAEFVGSPRINVFNVDAETVNNELAFSCGEFNHPLQIPSKNAPTQTISTLAIRPEDVKISSAENALLSGEVLYKEPIGSREIIYANINDNELRIETPPIEGYDTGDQIHLKFDTTRMKLFGAGGEAIQLMGTTAV